MSESRLQKLFSGVSGGLTTLGNATKMVGSAVYNIGGNVTTAATSLINKNGVETSINNDSLIEEKPESDDKDEAELIKE